MRFDCYAGNVWGGVPCAEVAELVAMGAGARAERGRPRGRYSDVFDLKDGADLVGWVGRDAVIDTAYFELKGSRTPDTAGAVRKWWPDSHTVSRSDACDDFDETEVLGRLVGIMDAAKDPRVQARVIMPRGADTGATYYWGSPRSAVQVRVYEAGKMKDRLHFARPQWVRAEVEVRPGKADQKRLAAKLEPLEMWGFAGWTQRAAEVLCKVEVGRYAPTSEPAQFDRTTLYLARQHRRHWVQMLEDFGSWECIGREFGSVWAADDEAEHQMKAALARR